MSAQGVTVLGDRIASLTIADAVILFVAWHMIKELIAWFKTKVFRKLDVDDTQFVTLSKCMERQSNCSALVNVAASIQAIKTAMYIIVLHSQIAEADKERALNALERRSEPRT